MSDYIVIIPDDSKINFMYGHEYVVSNEAAQLPSAIYLPMPSHLTSTHDENLN